MESYASAFVAAWEADGQACVLYRLVIDVAGSEVGTLESVNDGTLPKLTKKVASALLGRGKTNSLNEILGHWSTTSPHELINQWAPRRIGTLANSRLAEVSSSITQRRTSSVMISNVAYPDPTVVCADEAFHSRSLHVRWGWLHGDLHPGNVLCSDLMERRHTPGIFRLIDFAHSHEGALLYDHAYFKVALLIRNPIDDEDLLKLLKAGAAVAGGTNRPPPNLSKPDLDVIQAAVLTIDRAVAQWCDMQQAASLDAHHQALLADVAAGLEWAGKGALDDVRAAVAFKFAAFAIKRYLKVNALPNAQTLRKTYSTYSAPLVERDVVRTTPKRQPDAPGGPPAGPFLSGQILLNALLFTGSLWEELEGEDCLGQDLIDALSLGRRLEDPALARFSVELAKRQVFKDDRNLRAFLEIEDVGDEDLISRLELLGVRSSPANLRLRELLTAKRQFLAGDWLEGSKADLEHVATNMRVLPPSERTWKLRAAYYQAGIRLTVDQMSEAAIADFSDKRWLMAINGPSERQHPHLLKANEQVASLLVTHLTRQHEDRVREGQSAPHSPRQVSLIEGGVGGGHTALSVLRELEPLHDVRIRYAGIELVPTLAGELDARFRRPGHKGRRDEVISALGERLQPLRPGKRWVSAGPMETVLSQIGEELFASEGAEGGRVDAFMSSFAFHHVPNGWAIVQFVSNEAPAALERLDASPHREAIAKAMSDGCRALYDGFLRSLGEAQPRKAFEAIRKCVIDEIKETKYAPARVFLSLLDPAGIDKGEVDVFCQTIVERFWFPRDRLTRMLRNPQRELLLTVQSMLRDRGVLIIADPDGTSDFNAQSAVSDYELTIANFLTSGELRDLLADLGFEEIRSYELRADGDVVKAVPRVDDCHPRLRPEPHGLGYLVVAERSERRERELADASSRRWSTANQNGSSAELDLRASDAQEELGRLGDLLKELNPATTRVVEQLLSPPDPIPRSAALFRDLLPLRFALQKAGWIEALPGSAVVARKRVHRLLRQPGETGMASLLVATDLPYTPHELRAGVRKVFSYSDEAHMLRPRIREILDQWTGAEPWVLDTCSGSGMLGLLVATLSPQARVVCVDSEPACVRQIEENRALNRISADRLTVEEGHLWPSQERRYDLILADPPFALRPEEVGSEPRSEDGGPFGDRVSGELLRDAAHHLTDDGKLLILAYTLLRRSATSPPAMRLADFLKGSGLDGTLATVTDTADGEARYVWRYRHDKIAKNDPEEGMPIELAVIRLGDPTRLESIIYASPREQRVRFQQYRDWLRETLREYSGIQLVWGTFTRRTDNR